MTEAVRSRRRLLQAGLGLAAFGLGPVGRLLAAAGPARGGHPGYGPLRLVRDLETGLPLLQLPEGFSYRTLGWAGEPLIGDRACPGKHDGMGVVGLDGDIVTLVRNHEIGNQPGGSFAAPAATWDADCGGGTVTLRFDQRAGKLLDMRPSLSGTLVNCAGGTTPWGSWLSCEEIVLDAGQVVAIDAERTHTMRRSHGFVFEVPKHGVADPEPLLALGQFMHEAACVDPRSGIVYLTEDIGPECGFYRLLPTVRGDLRRGGALQMLKAVDAPDLRTGRRAGEALKVEWVAIDDPTAGRDAEGGGRGVQRQGFANGASKFIRLEGIVCGDDGVYFTSTSGGDAQCGQLWLYRPGAEALQLVYESPHASVLDYPDNITLSPRSGLVICEDSTQEMQRLYGMTPGGELYEFCRHSLVLDGTKGFSGDFCSAEWAGLCFSPDGKWLFANVYSPGFTVAITGPWRDTLI